MEGEEKYITLQINFFTFKISSRRNNDIWKCRILRVPWETIIKVYRQKLGEKNFGTVEQFALNFLEFIKSNEYVELTSQNEESKFTLHQIDEIVSSSFEIILEGLKEKVNKSDEETSEEELKAVANKFLDEMLVELDNTEFINCYGDEDFRTVLETYGDEIEHIILQTFENMIFSDDLVTNLKYIVASTLLKKFSESTSGVVIAGFGENELYPALIAYDIDGRINGKVKLQINKQKIVGKDLTGAIVPFAQDDMVHTFLRGINPEIEKITSNYLSHIFSGLSGVIVDNLKSELKDIGNSADIKIKIDEGLEKIRNEYERVLNEYKYENFTIPTLSIVNSLPKDELAEMAESLVNLTSFKRRVSSSLETVGGPVDVAVITKGDGLVWIKRKHYFSRELNNNFHQNYFRRDNNEPVAP